MVPKSMCDLWHILASKNDDAAVSGPNTHTFIFKKYVCFMAYFSMLTLLC